MTVYTCDTEMPLAIAERGGKERGSKGGGKGGMEKGRVGKRDSGSERERKRGREVNLNRKEMTTHMLLLCTYVYVLWISTHFKNNIPLLELFLNGKCFS